VGSGIEMKTNKGQIFTTASHHHDAIAPPPGVQVLSSYNGDGWIVGSYVGVPPVSVVPDDVG